MLYAVNTATMKALEALSGAPRVVELGIEFSSGWHEAAQDRYKDYFETNWGIPKSWDDAIIQGSHFYVCTPMNKSVSATREGKPVWSRTDLETLPTDALPATEYKPAVNPAKYDAAYNQWPTGSARAYYRVAWRCMGKTSNERMLIPALIPPGAAHPDAVSSAGIPQDDVSLCLLTGFLSSLLADFSVRVAPGHIRLGTINRLPLVVGHPLQSSIIVRTLRLNCLTSAYADLWERAYVDEFNSDRWTGGEERENRPDLGAVAPEWAADTPLRMDVDRRQALVEIDALVALMLGVAANQLCTIYRTQFGVLYGYDHRSNIYDANGRLVPNSILSVWRKRGDYINESERTATNQSGRTHIYELPFRLLDREADMRTAYAEFERRLAAL
jgi:hypothetical protein